MQLTWYLSAPRLCEVVTFGKGESALYAGSA